MRKLTRPRISLAVLVSAGLLCLLALAGCGSKQDALSAPSAKRFAVMLDFFPNADHAALYTAISHGDFRAVGLDRPFDRHTGSGGTIARNQCV